MAKTQVDHGGRPYRLITVNGIESRIDLETTKHTFYEKYGIVNGGLNYSYTLPDGREMLGYTDNPILVREYEEMWAEEEAGTAADPESGLLS